MLIITTEDIIMMHHMANILADKHAQDKANWLVNHNDETFNYTPSNCGPCELKVTNEAPDTRKNNIHYMANI
jgi:hypothetical protein